MIEDLVQVTRRHVERRFAESSIETKPFAHVVIENFFPDDVYADILRFNLFRCNSGSEWLSRDQSVNVSARTPYFARKQIDLDYSSELAAKPHVLQFWSRLRDCFMDGHWFAALVAASYPAYFRMRFGDLVDDPDFLTLLTAQLFVQRHEPGFIIGPHTDLPTRVFTCIFAFADREGFEDYGTQLLAPKDRLARCWGLDHYGPENFIVQKIAPYRPNNCLLFFKSRHSFHAVPAIDEHVPNQRYGMQFQLREPPQGLFRDLSMPELMHFPRGGVVV